jgi:hypothetical protein
VNLVEATDSEDRLEALRELRRQLAQAIDECSSGRDLASLSQRLMDCLEQIEAVERARSVPRGSGRDDVSRKRAERLAKAARPRRAAGGAQ